MFTTEHTISANTLTSPLSQYKIESPSVPVKDLVLEAEGLYLWALQDKDALLNAGIGAETIEQLRSLSRILCIAQSTWNSARKSHTNARLNWIKASRKAYELRNKLLHDFQYAYRAQPDTLALVREAVKGAGNTDMIQALMNLKSIGTDHPEALEKINFDFAQLDTAATMAEAMGTLQAMATASAASAGSGKVTRDSTYSCLKAKMTEIRECGKYLFYRNAERRQGYRSEYYRRHNSNKSANKNVLAVSIIPMARAA
jgi:hypothetical protein